ncbi:MAG: hypothetical protein H0T69_14495, partial [Thermoleophilaceae bacterium]|nr:hypothetical protein [Thermoleophilaceae bacterium]
MLVLIAVVVSVALARSLSELNLPDLQLAVAPGGAVVCMAVTLLAARFVVTRRTLRSRVGLAVVPADEFDPSPEAVLRFAAQLQRTRRRVRGWLDKRASAVRITLTNDHAGRLAYLIEAPAQAQETLRAALRAFDGLELRDPD